MIAVVLITSVARIGAVGIMTRLRNVGPIIRG
jgi:hypothetical protein